MSVVIHDFDLLVEPPEPPVTPRGDGAPAPITPPPAPRLRPLDLRDVQAHQARRGERLRAH